MRRTSIFFIIGLFLSVGVPGSFGNDGIAQGVYPDPGRISDVPEVQSFPISISAKGTVAEVTVRIDVEHSNLLNLDIRLTHNGMTVILFSGRQSRIPFGATEIHAIYDDPDPTVTNLGVFAGMEANGMWSLEFVDSAPGNGLGGTMKSWSIEIELAKFAYFEIEGAGRRSLKLQTDGYGSFGNKSFGVTPLGAYCQPESSIVGNTVYSSALFLHSDKSGVRRYLSSLDSFPGNRLPSVPVSRRSTGEWDSWFSLGSVEVSLIQKVDRYSTQQGTIVFRLLQEYEFYNRSDDPQPIGISRYINPKFQFNLNSQESVDNENYLYRKIWAEEGDIKKSPELFVFDKIESGTTTKTPFAGIGFRAIGESTSVFRVDDFYRSGEPQFDEKLLSEGWAFFDWPIDPLAWRDSDNDGLTDPGKVNGFDAALALGMELPFHKDRRVVKYVSITQWGYASPSEVMSSTEEFPFEFPLHVPTPTPIPPTPTYTPSPTHTPSPTLTPTPTKTPAPPRWIKPLPDIRVFTGRESPYILDLADYLFDPDTPFENLEVSWNFNDPRIKKGKLKLSSGNRILSASPFDETGDYGSLMLYIHDRTGVNFITRTTQIKASSFLTRSFRPVPPIVLAPGEASYTSSYRLNDLILDFETYPEGSFEWSVLGPLPDGIDSVIIHKDTSFTVMTEAGGIHKFASLRFKVRRLHVPVTPSPVPTDTMTPVPPTPTDTPTPTETPLPTATSTPVPTATFTPEPTSTPTQPPTPTVVPPSPTNTPIPFTPTPTLPTASTPTPSTPTATPLPGCADAFVFSPATVSRTRMGPADWLVVSGESNSKRLAVAHYDEGTIGFYEFRNNRFELKSQIPAQLGVANLAAGWINNDASPDLFVLNAAQETLAVYLVDEKGFYKAGWILDLREERLPDIYDLGNGVRYQALVAGRINGDNYTDVLIRTRNSVLVVLVEDGQMRIGQRLDFEGSTRSIKGGDLDGDGDLDLIAAVRTPKGEEQLQIYQNQGGDLVWIQTLRTDWNLQGDYPDEIVCRDENGDGIIDLTVLVFSGDVLRFLGNPNGIFTQISGIGPFPPGEVVAFDVADLNRDGKSDLVALHRSQDGLALLAVCGWDDFGRASFPISKISPSGEMYVMQCHDLDGDGDLDIVATRNFEDNLIWIENRVPPPDNSARQR